MLRASLMQIFLTFRIDRNRLATVAHSVAQVDVACAKEIFWAFLHSCYWLENVNTFPSRCGDDSAEQKMKHLPLQL